MMKNLFFCLLLGLISHQSQANLNSESGLDLREKLMDLYNSSSMPYPIEQIAMHSVDENSKFAGCAVVDQFGEVTVGDDMLFYKAMITTKQGAGPLDPPIKKLFYKAEHRSYLKSYLSAGAIFKNGVLHLDSISWSPDKDTILACGSPLSLKDQFIGSSSGLSPDRKSYQFISVCRDGTPFHEIYARMAFEYLVYRKLLSDSRNRELFGYCWK